MKGVNEVLIAMVVNVPTRKAQQRTLLFIVHTVLFMLLAQDESTPRDIQQSKDLQSHSACPKYLTPQSKTLPALSFI